jgi:hypothetical protein
MNTSTGRVGVADQGEIVASVAALNWQNISAELDECGYAVIKSVLSADDCLTLAEIYPHDDQFRKRIDMTRHNFGRGEYKYFDYPLPDKVAELRAGLFPHLANIANHWCKKSGVEDRFPEAHDEFIERCHRAGQYRPTPLLLRYGEGDYNRLHQDLYGEQVFPIQVAILLSMPDIDFTGGEFILTEQRPRMQSRAEVVPLAQGDAVIFPVRQRPVRGTRGYYRVNMRHGVSRIRSGHRLTLGIIFHDAQ